jgi:hypothetical protein
MGGVDMDDLFPSNEFIEDTSVALEKAAIDHDALVRLLDPTRHAE